MPTFKLKRPHSIENIGINNYKRRKLISDFESLSLTDKPPPITPPVTNIIANAINLPKSVKNRLLSTDRDNSDNSFSEDILNSKILDWIKEDSLKLVKWVDWRYAIYVNWCNWYKIMTHFNGMVSNDKCCSQVSNVRSPIIDIDMDTYDDINVDEDVDMDVDMDGEQ